MKLTVHEHPAAVSAAADALCEYAAENPKANIGLVLNSDCFQVLHCAFRPENRQVFRDCRFFVLNELCPPFESGITGFRSRFEREFPFAAGNCEYVSPDAPQQLDESIAAAGGLDLVLNGIGSNASLAMNEPSTPFDSGTHVQRLTAASKADAAEFFRVDAALVPDKAVTAGIETIIRARRIVTAAFGTGKADAVFKMVYARTDSTAPAAFLQVPAQSAVYLDRESASKL